MPRRVLGLHEAALLKELVCELGLAIKLLVTLHHEIHSLRHTSSREQEWQFDRGKAERV